MPCWRRHRCTRPAGSPPITRRTKGSLAAPVRSSRRCTAEASTVPRASWASPATLPAPCVDRSTVGPTARTSRSRPGSSLPARRTAPAAPRNASARESPSSVTTAAARGGPAIRPASRRMEWARAAVPVAHLISSARARTLGTGSPGPSAPATIRAASLAATACGSCVICVMYTDYSFYWILAPDSSVPYPPSATIESWNSGDERSSHSGASSGSSRDAASSTRS